MHLLFSYINVHPYLVNGFLSDLHQRFTFEGLKSQGDVNGAKFAAVIDGSSFPTLEFCWALLLTRSSSFFFFPPVCLINGSLLKSKASKAPIRDDEYKVKSLSYLGKTAEPFWAAELPSCSCFVQESTFSRLRKMQRLPPKSQHCQTGRRWHT